MICKKCGFEFNKGIFCPKCGTKNAEEESLEQTTVHEHSEENNIVAERSVREKSELEVENGEDSRKDTEQLGKKTTEVKLPWYCKTWFLILVFFATIMMAGIPAIVLTIIRMKKYPSSARKTIPIWILFIILVAVLIWASVTPNRDNRENDNFAKNTTHNESSMVSNAKETKESQVTTEEIPVDLSWRLHNNPSRFSENFEDIQYGLGILSSVVKKTIVDEKYSKYLKTIKTIYNNHSQDKGVALNLEDSLFGNLHFERKMDGGVVYYGELKDNKPSGDGILFYFASDSILPGDSIYIGEFSKGLPDGIGMQIFESDNGNSKYFRLAEFDEGKIDGTLLSYGYEKKSSLESKAGKEYHEVIRLYDYQNGKKDGNSKVYFDDTLIEEAHYEDDQKNGKGKVYYTNGILKYEGEFKDGLYDGEGILFNEDGSVEYEGKFKEGNYSS